MHIDKDSPNLRPAIISPSPTAFLFLESLVYWQFLFRFPGSATGLLALICARCAPNKKATAPRYPLRPLVFLATQANLPHRVSSSNAQQQRKSREKRKSRPAARNRQEEKEVDQVSISRRVFLLLCIHHLQFCFRVLAT